jgi:hypothetical protein
LKEQEGRIGNLEDSIDALSGRLESEINRAEKLHGQSQSMRELLDKQARVRSAQFLWRTLCVCLPAVSRDRP